jgi:hypothetical protein
MTIAQDNAERMRWGSPGKSSSIIGAPRRAAAKEMDFAPASMCAQLTPAPAAEGSSERSAPAKPALAVYSMNRPFIRRTLWPLFLLPLLIAASCRSYIVQVTVENHTGGAVNLLEVDYPSASFGVDTLPAGAVYRYRLQLQDSGPITVQYTAGEKQQRKSTGPTVHEKQQGQIEIVLDPNGKTEFHPALNPPN